MMACNRIAAASMVLLAALACAPSMITARPAADPQDPFACDPLQEEVCGYPFPNNFWRNNNTGKLNLTLDVFPLSNQGKAVNPDIGGWNELDGFSPLSQIVTYFPKLDLYKSGFAQLWNIPQSLADDAACVILNAETGQRVANWAELDHSADDDIRENYERSLLVWPSERLNDSSRYIVAMRFLKQSDGKTIKPSDAFAALRDNKPSTNPAVESRRQHFEDNIFKPLSAAGISRSDLVLAWDFTVMSRHTISNRIVSMRDDALQRVEKNPMKFRILYSKDNPRPGVGREIKGEFDVPWYLNKHFPGADVRVNTLPGDPNTAVYNGEGKAFFEAIIPSSLMTNGSKPGAILQYGHGLFGSASEIGVDYLVNEANRNGWVLIATNWIGMCWEDEVPAGIMADQDLSNFAMIPDRSHQGMLNFVLLMRLATSQSFMNNEHLMYNGRSVIDPTKRYYDGNSQGGIYGTVYMAVSPDIPRGVIGVGGAPYAMLLPRSADFNVIFDILKIRYSEPRERIFILSAMELLWSRIGPGGYLHYVSDDPLPNTPKHTLLCHYGLGDAQVTWLGMLTLSRSIGAHMYQSNVREGNETLYGFQFIPDSQNLTGTGQHLVQGFDFGSPHVPFINKPADKAYDTHESVRRDPQAQEAARAFLEQGVIFNPCGGACHGNRSVEVTDEAHQAKAKRKSEILSNVFGRN